MIFRYVFLLTLFAGTVSAQTLPRTADGKPDFHGIWQVQNTAAYNLEAHVAQHNVPAGLGVVEGGEIPYQPWALEQRRMNYENQAVADPLESCFLPGVPRVMYLDYPFQIFQMEDRIAITFEWTQVFRLIYTDGQPPEYEGIESWMGDSRGRWEGDVLVVEVAGQNGKTWFDAAGNFHTDALHVTERYRMVDADTIEYEATIEDPNVFTEPWTISMPIHRQKDKTRILEYQCQAVAEEANGDFERDLNTWYPAAPPEENVPFDANAAIDLPPVMATAELPRMPDGKPDITALYRSDAGGANYGLEPKERVGLAPGTRGVVVDPPDGTLPYQAWARAESIDRFEIYRGYDDPTAHCFVAGVPRSHYVPAPFKILQPPGYIVILHERMSYRLIDLNRTEHIPDNIRLWQGDSIGRWEGDTLVVETANFNGKAWLNEAGDVTSHAQTIVETFTPVSADQIIYRAKVSDPIAYTRPWTIEMPFNRMDGELLEVACLEDNGDLDHLRDVRDEHRAGLNREE